jgi:hypothetical protein
VSATSLRSLGPATCASAPHPSPPRVGEDPVAPASELARVPRQRGRELSGAELEAFVRELADRPELWIDLVKHDATQRLYEELLSDEHVTAWLICWLEDHDTGFHDHDVSSGAVAVVSGAVREERLTVDGAPRESVFAASPPACPPPAAARGLRRRS